MSSTFPNVAVNAGRNPVHSSNEIDLRELILALWRSRVTIVAVTVLVVALAAVYAFLSTPLYQTQAKALPPTASGLEAYNKAFRMSGPAVEGVVSNLSDAAKDRLVDEAIPSLSPDDAYQYFTRRLASASLRRDFFETYFLPEQGLSESITDAQYEQLWRQFQGQISVELPARGAGHTTVTSTGSNPTEITDWANLYLQHGITAAQNELAKDLGSALHGLSNSLTEQMASLRGGAQKEREQRIVRLTESLQLAESIGLNTPSTAGNLITSYSGETTYMRGAEALRNEITLLKSRVSDDPFIPELVSLQMRQDLLATVNVGPDDIAVARVDQVAITPSNPIKPRKALILALGLVLGGMLGVFVVLIRNMFKS